MDPQDISMNGNNDKRSLAENERVGNGDTHTVPTEIDGLLPAQTADIQVTVEPENDAPEKSRWNRRKLRLCVVLFLILVFIASVIVISLLLCSATQQDVDEKFDPSTFKVPLLFNGSFQLPNLAFTEQLFNISSNESQGLTAHFQTKLADLYSSSPALGRYFSEADIYAFREGSVFADFRLVFVVPEEKQDELRNFTVSREMVYNVLRQFLYDQTPDESDPMYIDPVSLIILPSQR
ncbi:uncharacterized protein V6R79_008222 [Siganus canaliculatus]